jgi:hypothetical protein
VLWLSSFGLIFKFNKNFCGNKKCLEKKDEVIHGFDSNISDPQICQSAKHSHGLMLWDKYHKYYNWTEMSEI